jgi:hypothetical protein
MVLTDGGFTVLVKRRWQDERLEDVQIMCSGGNVFPVGPDVLYTVDYTGVIDNFNESQFWTSTQWINCEN